MSKAASPAKQLSQNQLTVILVMLAVVVWVIGLIISKAVFQTILFNNKVIGEKRSVDNTLQDNLNKTEDIRRNFQALIAEGVTAEKIARALPTGQDVPGLASKLEALMAASGVSFRSFSLEGADPNASGGDPATENTPTTDAPTEFFFTLKVEGPYTNIVLMLQNFEKEITPMRITNIKIDGSQQLATAELNIKAFYQDPVKLEFPKETIKP